MWLVYFHFMGIEALDEEEPDTTSDTKSQIIYFYCSHQLLEVFWGRLRRMLKMTIDQESKSQAKVKKIWGRYKLLLLKPFLGLLKSIVHLFPFSDKLFKYFDLTGACVSRWCWLQWLTPMLTEEYSLLSPLSGHQASEVRKVWLESPHQQSQSIRNNFKFLHPSSFSASPREFPTSSSHFRHRLKWVICVILRWRDDAFYI